MAQAGLEHEVELASFKRHVHDGSEPVVPLQFLRCFGVDGAVVLDPPRVNSASPQRSDQFPAGGPGDQELVSAASVPDDLDQVIQISGIGKLTPDLAIGTSTAVVLEIVAIYLVGCGRTPRSAQPHHLGYDNVSRGIG